MPINLEIALRIKADVVQVKLEVSQLVATDFVQSQRYINSTATAFAYAGLANVSLRDSLRGVAKQFLINATASGCLQASQRADTANALPLKNLTSNGNSAKALSAERYAATMVRQ